MSLNDGRVTVVLFFAICAVVLGNTLISGGRDKNRAIAPSSLDYTQPLPVRSHRNDGQVRDWLNRRVPRFGRLRTPLY